MGWLTTKLLAWITGPIILALLLALGVQSLRVAELQKDAVTVDSEHRTELAERDLAIANARAAFEAAAREAEKKKALALNKIATEYELEKRDAQAAFAAEIDSVRTGARRLQRRFQCPASTAAGSVPGATERTGVDDGAAETGFTRADAEVALRIAADGDDAIRQLTACQTTLQALTEKKDG